MLRQSLPRGRRREDAARHTARLSGACGDAYPGTAEARRGDRGEVRSGVPAVDSSSIDKVDGATAGRIYAQFVGEGAPPEAEYKLLQDYLFRYIAGECGRLGVGVILHTMAGAGSYFDVAGANPLLLESVLEDPALRQTKFVMVHGGWPLTTDYGTAGKAQRVSGLLRAVAAGDAGDAGAHAARVAGMGAGEGDVRDGRVSLLERVWDGRNRAGLRLGPDGRLWPGHSRG